MRREALALVTWALSYVDWKIVDEAIGFAEQADRKPVKPRAVAPQILRRAEKIGMYLEAFVPPSEAVEPAQAPQEEE